MSLRELSLTYMSTTLPPPVPWVCDGLVARGALTLLAGEPGRGKSWLALGLAMGVSEGSIVAGIPCHQGSTLYIDAENGASELHRRVHQLGLKRGVAFYESEGFDLDSIDELDAYFVKHQPTLIVLDGLRSLWSGDENDSGAVTHMLMRLRERLRRFDVGCLLIHHLNKTGGYRGSGALAAEPEVVVQMSSVVDEPVYTQLTWHKCRMGTPPAGQRFRVVTRLGETRLST